METPRPPEAGSSVRSKAKVPSPAELDTLYRSVNGKFRDSAELRLEAGRAMLETLYGGDADLALAPEGQFHPPWLAFRRLAGGRKVKPPRGVLRRALRLAAHEKTIQGGFYANLDVALREELLPLAEPDDIRAAAQHCIENNWGQRALRKHVKGLLRAAGQGYRATPDAIARAATGPLDRFAEAHATPAQLRNFEQAFGKLSPDEKARAREKIRRAWAALSALRKLLK